ncbi:hypothetical protein CDAR_98221 [Caerostris darwini]|uniref:Uncharacterized protein n=1 Tax=Caerostris darwini TaxID=1538125 RepID=A0AAV4UFL6_9ARAC|nr:hypothetical protein CDAR_98221 [Caerostris darwini]
MICVTNPQCPAVRDGHPMSDLLRDGVERGSFCCDGAPLEQGPHLQPPSAWIRVILSLLAVPSRHPEQPPRWRRLWNCAICAHNTAFVGKPLLKGQGSHLQPPSAWIRVVRSLLAVPSRHPEQPPRWRRLWNCAICAHNTAFVGKPLLSG